MNSFAIKCMLMTILFVSGMPVKNLLAQTAKIDQLRNELAGHPQQDTFRVNRINSLAFELRNKIPAEASSLYQESLVLSRKLHHDIGEGAALIGLGFYNRFAGNFPEAISYTKEALQKFILLKDTLLQITCIYNLAYISANRGESVRPIDYSFEALRLAEKINSSKWLILINVQLGNFFSDLDEIPKAKTHLNKALDLAKATHDRDGIAHCITGLENIALREEQWEEVLKQSQQGILFAIESRSITNRIEHQLAGATAYINLKRYDEAFSLIDSTINIIHVNKFVGFIPWADAVLAKAYYDIGKMDSAIFHGLRSVKTRQERDPDAITKNIQKLLGQAYAQKGDFKEAYSHQLAYTNYRDSANETEIVKRIAATQYTYDLDKKQSEIDLLAKNEKLVKEKNEEQQKLLWGTWAAVVLLCSMLFFLWRNNQERRKTNVKLQQQQDELKAAQSQLIQSEKMASLGELTAGIAHEIQNPLNFVNNFSDVNTELIEELKTEASAGNTEEVIAIANDIKANEEKINHHGKRADAIVKGMLQHSRTSTGHTETTDINALADEYLRLSYHGLRAKNKSFNATINTDFDNSIGKINLIPQDIGRVLLNLYNNAFYAASLPLASPDPGYKHEPTISVSTKRTGDNVFISVKDNGPGITQNIIDKIFQPFFTTKPTGQGTGLGLSLAYDIIKAHGGEIKVKTVENGGSEFIIILPS